MSTSTIIRYIDNLKNMSEYIDNNKRMSAENKMLIDSLTGRASPGMGTWLDKQLKLYADNGKALNELSQKHIIASGVVQKYPELRDKVFAGENNLESINLPIILSIGILSGSIMTLYDSISFKIKLQNKYLNDIDNKVNQYTAGQISEVELNTYIASLKDYVYKPPVNLAGAVLIGGLIFGAFYIITQPAKIKKLLKAVN
jgi:hypothetical protein